MDGNALALIGFGLSAFLAAAAIVILAVAVSKRRRALHKVRTESVMQVGAAEGVVKKMRTQITALRPLLDEVAQQRVADLMGPLSPLLEHFAVSNEDIEFLQHIGSGASSQVWRVSVNGEILAAKKLASTSTAGLKQFRDECLLLTQIQSQLNNHIHPNLVNLRYVSYRNELLICLDLANGGSLADALYLGSTGQPFNSGTKGAWTRGIVMHVATGVCPSAHK